MAGGSSSSSMRTRYTRLKLVMRKLRVGVLFGGRSGEHEVSLLSAASILKAIDPKKYEVVPIGITKEGLWVTAAGAKALLAGGAAPELSQGSRARSKALPASA